MPETRPCCLCGEDRATFLFETRDRLLELPGTYRFVRCRACGLVYLDPQPAWAQRAAHYSLAYRGYHRLETEPSPLQRQGIKYGLRKRVGIITSHLSGGRLLDAGCGGGDFVHWMQQQPRWRALGLERTPAVARAARQRYEADVIVGDLGRACFAPSSFDVVTLWTVLEHLADPIQALRECTRLLRPRGLLVVRTVSGESWGARLFGPNWVGYDAPRILTVFSRHTLRQMLLDTGFEVVHMGCHFHDFYPYLWSLHNLCQEHIGSPLLCRLADKIGCSWPVRLSSFPFFALQTRLGRNSFVTAVARKL